MLEVKTIQKKKDVDSTAVETVRYNYALGILTVTFINGTVYDYLDVPADIYAQVANSESVGKAFSSLVRNNYSYTKLKQSSA